MDGLLKTTVIDAKNNKQETFANGSGLTVKSLQYKHIDPDTTTFGYDPAGNTLWKYTANMHSVNQRKGNIQSFHRLASAVQVSCGAGGRKYVYFTKHIFVNFVIPGYR